jgi:hypothetical protein
LVFGALVLDAVKLKTSQNQSPLPSYFTFVTRQRFHVYAFTRRNKVMRSMDCGMHAINAWLLAYDDVILNPMPTNSPSFSP